MYYEVTNHVQTTGQDHLVSILLLPHDCHIIRPLSTARPSSTYRHYGGPINQQECSHISGFSRWSLWIFASFHGRMNIIKLLNLLYSKFLHVPTLQGEADVCRHTRPKDYNWAHVLKYPTQLTQAPFCPFLKWPLSKPDK